MPRAPFVIAPFRSRQPFPSPHAVQFLTTLRRRWLPVALAGGAIASGCAGPSGALALREDRAGREALAAGHSQPAYVHFRKAAQAAPSDDAIFRHEVEAARAVGKLDALTEVARRRAQQHPTEATAHYRLGLCLFAHTAGERAGLAELAQAAALAPADAEFQLRLGSALLEAERPDEAVTPLRAAMQLRPAEAHPHLPLALALHRSGRDSDAIAQLAQALPLLPSADDLKAYRHLMDRIADRTRTLPPSARARFEDALAVLEQADAPARAVDLLEELSVEQPLLPPVQTALGLANLRAGDNAQAVSHLRRAIELDPAAAEPYLYLGQIYHELRRDPEARQQLRAAVARDPLLESAHDLLSQLAFQAGDLEETIQEARTLLGLREGEANTRVFLAQALTASGDVAGAERELRTVAALPGDTNAPDVPAAGTTRLQAQLELGGLEVTQAQRARDPVERGRRFDEARGWLRKVIKSQPDNLAAQQLLAQVPR